MLALETLGVDASLNEQLLYQQINVMHPFPETKQNQKTERQTNCVEFFQQKE